MLYISIAPHLQSPKQFQASRLRLARPVVIPPIFRPPPLTPTRHRHYLRPSRSDRARGAGCEIADFSLKEACSDSDGNLWSDLFLDEGVW